MKRMMQTVALLVGLFSASVGGFLAMAQTDTSPPTIDVTATPTELWPPNGRMVTVTFTGTITDAESGVDASKTFYEVLDEYNQFQPTGPLTLAADGTFSVLISLQAFRNGQDVDGRQYRLVAVATDLAGNTGIGSTTVRVPH